MLKVYKTSIKRVTSNGGSNRCGNQLIHLVCTEYTAEFLNFKTPYLNLERVKLETLNSVYG